MIQCCTLFGSYCPSENGLYATSNDPVLSLCWSKWILPSITPSLYHEGILQCGALFPLRRQLRVKRMIFKIKQNDEFGENHRNQVNIQVQMIKSLEHKILRRMDPLSGLCHMIDSLEGISLEIKSTTYVQRYAKGRKYIPVGLLSKTIKSLQKL